MVQYICLYIFAIASQSCSNARITALIPCRVLWINCCQCSYRNRATRNGLGLSGHPVICFNILACNLQSCLNVKTALNTLRNGIIFHISSIGDYRLVLLPYLLIDSPEMAKMNSIVAIVIKCLIIIQRCCP